MQSPSDSFYVHSNKIPSTEVTVNLLGENIYMTLDEMSE